MGRWFREPWNLGAARELTAGSLGAEGFHGFRARPDEGDAGIQACTWQGSVFREKPVAGMQGITTGAARHIHKFIDAKIASREGPGRWGRLHRRGGRAVICGRHH